MSRDLEQRVAEQFQKQGSLRILFFFDPEEEEREAAENWNHDEIRCVEAGPDLFGLKYRLERELSGERVFLYVPRPKPTDWSDNPLADLWVANRELQIDDVAELMEDLGLSSTDRDLVERYYGELRYKGRQQFLGRVLQGRSIDEDALRWGLAAYHAKETFDDVSFRSSPRGEQVLAAVMIGATEEETFEAFVEQCDDLGLTDLLGRRLGQRFELGTTDLSRGVVEKTAQTLKYNLLLRYVDAPADGDPYRELWIEDELARNRIVGLADSWWDTRAFKKSLEETLGALAPQVDETRLADMYGPDTTFGYLTPALRRRRLERAVGALDAQPSRARRVADDLRGEERPVAAAAEAVWQMGTFYRLVGDHPTLDFGEPEAFIERYADELYRADTAYRRAVAAYRRARRQDACLHDLIEGAFEQFQADYHEDFVHPLNTAWQQALEAQVETEGDLNSRVARRQGRFHADHIAPRSQKTAVIVSDALRYEVAQELVGELSEDARKQVDLSPTLAALPTVTSLGMAHLLPHDSVTLGKEARPEIEGRSTSGTRNRERILQSSNADAKALRYEDVRGKSIEEGRELFKGHPLAYIYHDRIDATGDERDTETQVISEIEEAIEELARLVQTLNNWNFRRVLITADHGFLYAENEIPDSMVESFPEAEGIRLRKSRSIVAEQIEGAHGYRFPLRALSDVDEDLTVAVPRAVNRYRLRGAGKQYAHGGASLQEMIVPTLEVNKAREDVAEKVGVRLLSGERTIKSGALTAQLLQTESVASGRQPRTVHAALYDDDGNVVSKEEKITLDARSEDPTERKEKLVLTLGSEANDLTLCRLKVFDVEDHLNPLVDQKYSIQQLIERDF
ncbi:uncharacterized protein (TIGR02687 family) [Salinibacter ruber]|jgi:uncharacterized protein (TIGR02687 family)|uniref:BREX-1 system phosphatase PglZ type A n=1 Tax=Salinibacter ruber TaxID=146919 RepID=UPI0021671582|nr:BREX-1 system phosphatase PglZ type A [Salinibacter ruber]MCS4180167.1 uncharacterized protein (TIGR02687 family) [Salinibacter ruber]